MPELPEVETIVRKLCCVLPGKTITQLTQLHAKTFHGSTTLMVGLRIQDVRRRAKIIRICLENHQNLLIHLKMTGQLIYLDHEKRIGGGHPTPDWINKLPSKHTRVFFTFDDASQLFFNDQRLFGWIKLVDDETVAETFAALAPDVTDEIFTIEYLQPKIKNRSQNIKQISMDNTIMCGLGNIYVCDTLNLARLHPLRLAKSLTPAEVAAFVTAAKTILMKGIELGGTTFDDAYVDIDGLAGHYQSVVRVYGRDGKPCLNCQTPIQKMKLGGRGTYYCPHCQV